MKINLCMGCMRELEEENGSCPHCGFDMKSYTPSAHHLRPGTILNGKYLIGKVLGEGGFGITYVGYDLNLQMKIAVKEYYPNGLVTRSSGYGASLTALSGDKTQMYLKGMERFLDEARKLAKFSGFSNIVSVRDFFQENNTAYLVMEFIEGKSLKEMIKHGGYLPAEQVLGMMRPVMESLETVHAAGLIHRDISPDNLMILPDGQVKLIDFGAARDYSADSELSVVVKNGYAPEEQYSSRGVQGPWTDVYALCATIYRAVTGVMPEDALDRVGQDTLMRPAELGIVLPPEQEQAILKGLSVHSKDRFQTVRELMDALYGTEKPKKKNKKIIIPVCLAAAVLLALITYKMNHKSVRTIQNDDTRKSTDIAAVTVSPAPSGAAESSSSEDITYDFSRYLYVYEISEENEYKVVNVAVGVKESELAAVILPHFEKVDGAKYVAVSVEPGEYKQWADVEVKADYELEFALELEECSLDFWMVSGDVEGDTSFYEETYAEKDMEADYIYTVYDGERKLKNLQIKKTQVSLTGMEEDENGYCTIQIDTSTIPKEAQNFPVILLDESGCCVGIGGYNQEQALAMAMNGADYFYGRE